MVCDALCCTDTHEFVHAGVENRLADQRKGAMPNGMRSLPTVHQHPWKAPQRMDHRYVLRYCLLHDLKWVIDAPAPFSTNRVLVVPPAESASATIRRG